MSIRSNRSTRRNFQPTSGLGIESAPSSRIAINLGRIDLLQRHVLRTRKVHVIVVSQVLTSGFGDALGANRVESSITSDESTHFGCIGHGCFLCMILVIIILFFVWGGGRTGGNGIGQASSKQEKE